MSEANPRTLDWSTILTGLARLRSANPQVLERNVLVGGAACLFYRDQLERINDPDFHVRTYSEEEEKIWLSRDADFATTEPDQMPDSAGNVPLGRLQMGFVLGAEEFRENARHLALRWDGTEFTILIADPLDLWREKEAAIYRRARPQDSLHLEVLEITLQWELAYYAEGVPKGFFSPSQWIARAKEVKMRHSSIFKSPKLRDRLLAVDVTEISNFVTSSQPRLS